MATEGKNHTIDTVKGIAIFLVLCGHVIQYAITLKGQDYFLNPEFKVIYTFHMPLFVFISGYLVAFSLKRRNLWDVFKSRCQSLLVPCVTWGVLGGITSYLVYVMEGQDLGSGAWFIWFLFTLFMVSALLLLSLYLQRYVGIASFILVYVLLLLIPYNSEWSLHNIKWFYVFYVAGYAMGSKAITIPSPSMPPAFAALILGLFVVLTSFWTRNDFIHINQMNFLTHDILSDVLRIIYRYVVGFLGIMIVFYAAAQMVATKPGKVLAYVGGYSMNIYVIQRYVIEGLYPKLLHLSRLNLDFTSPLFLYLFVPAVAACGVFICIFISDTLLKKNPLLNKLLLGGRA